MKECPACKSTYDDTLIFCLQDGTPLTNTDDPETTLIGKKLLNPLISPELQKKYSRLMEEDKRLFMEAKYRGIPTSMLTTAYTTYAHAALLADEKPALLYDNSFLQNGRTGCLITEKGVYYKNTWKQAGHVSLCDINSVQVFSYLGLKINGSIKIDLERGSRKNIELICLMLLESLK